MFAITKQIRENLKGLSYDQHGYRNIFSFKGEGWVVEDKAVSRQCTGQDALKVMQQLLK